MKKISLYTLAVVSILIILVIIWFRMKLDSSEQINISQPKTAIKETEKTNSYSWLEIRNNNVVLVDNNTKRNNLTNDWTEKLCNSQQGGVHEITYTILSSTWEYLLYKKDDHYCEADFWNRSYFIVNFWSGTTRELSPSDTSTQYPFENLEKLGANWYYTIASENTDIDLWPFWFYDSKKLNELWYINSWSSWIKKIDFPSIFN